MNKFHSFKRPILYVLLAALVVLLVYNWNKDFPPSQPATGAATQSQQASGDSSAIASTMRTIPDKKESKATPKGHRKPVQAVDKMGKTHSNDLIMIKTDTLVVAIDPHGGDIRSASLLKYSQSLDDKSPISILSNDPHDRYIAQSYLASSNKGEAHQPVVFKSAKQSYSMGDNKELAVTLTGQSASGLAITKTYLFKRDSYQVQVDYDVNNNSGKPWEGHLYTQLVRKKPVNTEASFYRRSYMGASISSPKRPYHKVSYKDMNKENVDTSNVGGWVAMQQHYFVSAWVPESTKTVNHFYSYVLSQHEPRPVYVIGFKGAPLSIGDGQSLKTKATLYVGPEDTDRLAKLAPGLNHTIDFGVLWPISIIIFTVMSFCNRFLGNWGWSIVTTTIIIKVVFYWFSAKSFISMAKMRDLQPKIKALQEQHANDKQALSQATMALYKKEGVSPLGGCLPMIIQIPVFIALYYVIFESVQLRQAPFIFWIHDLSAADPYYVLPILMVVSMVVQQLLSPTASDPAQAKMMLIVPLVMGFLFRNFPAGLVLYWCVNNLVQALQQWYVTQRFHAGKYRDKKKKKKQKF